MHTLKFDQAIKEAELRKLKFYFHVIIIHKINILIPQLRNGILIFSPLHIHYDFMLNYTKLSIDYYILLIFI